MKVLGAGGPVVVAIHGYLARGAYFDAAASDWARSFRLFVPDLRGFGASRDLPGPFVVARHAADVAALLEANGVASAHVLGHSMGGLVAQALALHRPRLVRSLALLATFAHKPATRAERWQERFMGTALRKLAPGKALRLVDPALVEALGKMNAEQFEFYRDMLADNRDDVARLAVRDLFRFDSRPHLRRLRQPALVLAAEDDLVVPVRHARELAKELPEARLVVFDSGGHALLPRQGSAVVARTLDFWTDMENRASR